MKRYYLRTRLQAVWRILRGYDFLQFHFDVPEGRVSCDGVMHDNLPQNYIDAFIEYVEDEIEYMKTTNAWKTKY